VGLSLALALTLITTQQSRVAADAVFENLLLNTCQCKLMAISVMMLNLSG